MAAGYWTRAAGYWRAAVLAILVAATVVTVSMPADTQPSPRGGKVERRGNKRLERLRERILRKKVGLSEDKVEKVVAIFHDQQTERFELDKQMRSARKAIGRLLQSDSDDQAAYQSELAQLRAAHAGLDGLRDKQLAELAKILEPKEQVKLLRAMELVRRRFERRRRNRRR